MPKKDIDPMASMESFFAPKQGADESPENEGSDMVYGLSPKLKARINGLSSRGLMSLVVDFMSTLTPDEQEAAIADAESQGEPPVPDSEAAPSSGGGYSPDFIGAGGP